MQENARLKEQNDDLQAQLLNRQIEEGCSLLQGKTSLAAELDNLPRDDVSTLFKAHREHLKSIRIVAIFCFFM